MSVPPSATFISCWPPQMPSEGTAPRCAARVMANSKAVRRSLVVTVSCLVAAPKRVGVHVEGAAGDDEAVHRLQEALRKVRLVRQRDRNPAGRRDRGAVVLADRIPGLAGIAAGRLGIERETDDGLSHAPTVA